MRPKATPSAATFQAVPLAAAIGFPLWDRGGFTATSQRTFILFALAALLLAVSADPGSAVRATRQPVVAVLLVLASYTMLSAAWTVGRPGDAIRWGLVMAGLAATAVCASQLARTTGASPFLAAVAGIGIVQGLIGLVAVAEHALPFAQAIDGRWRPGGTFEYPPAYALIASCALPATVCGAMSGSRLLQWAATATATLLGSMLWLSADRLALALAVVLLAVCACRLPRARVAVTWSGALLLTGGATAAVAFGPAVEQGHGAAGWPAALSVLAVCALAGALYVCFSRPYGGRGHARASVLAAVLATTVFLACGAQHGPRARSDDARATEAGHGATVTAAEAELLHGRLAGWRAAVDTWMDRPVLGSGALSYGVASVPHAQGQPTLFAHNLPLELAAELGIPGLLLGIGIYAAGIATIVRARHQRHAILVGGTTACFLASNLVDWTWHLTAFAAIWAAATGTLWGCTPDGGARRERARAR